MEYAAVEASWQHDWVVQNEAVIQLCWLLSQSIIEVFPVEKLTNAWAELIMIHSIRFQEYQQYKVK